MAIALRSSTTVASTTRTNTTVTAPAGAVTGSDVIVVFIDVNGSSLRTITTPSGWTVVGPVQYSNPDPYYVNMYMFYRVHDGASSWTFNHTSAISDALCEAWSGVDTTTPLDTTSAMNGYIGSNNAGNGTATVNSITIATVGARELICRGAWDGTPITPPAGWTERIDQFALWVGDKTASTTGPTGSMTMDSGNTVPYAGGLGPWGTIHAALRPAGTGSTVTLTTAVATATAVALSPAPGQVAVTLTPKAVTTTAVALTATPQPVAVTLTPASTATTAPALSPSGGTISVTLTPAAATMTAVPLAATPQPVSVTLGAAATVTTAPAMSPSGGQLSVSLTPATVATTARALTPQAAVVLTPAAVTTTARPLSPLASVTLTPATITVTAVSLSPSGGSVTVTLTAATVTTSATALSPASQAATVTLTAATLTLAAQPLSGAPGLVGVTLVAAQVTLTAPPLSAGGPVGPVVPRVLVAYLRDDGSYVGRLQDNSRYEAKVR